MTGNLSRFPVLRMSALGHTRIRTCDTPTEVAVCHDQYSKVVHSIYHAFFESNSDLNDHEAYNRTVSLPAAAKPNPRDELRIHAEWSLLLHGRKGHSI